MKDDLQKELEKVFEKHGIRRVILLSEYKEGFNNNQPIRVIVAGEQFDGECQYAHLFEDCVNVSEGLRGILSHVTHHSTQKMAQMAGESIKEDRIVN